jgi:hypothetical protein
LSTAEAGFKVQYHPKNPLIKFLRFSQPEFGLDRFHAKVGSSILLVLHGAKIQALLRPDADIPLGVWTET